mmetsp:Transcript_13302/g.20733  ORF Transcript_13302/g.20733 Transcript_13302/m.20733 type:complete len:201 (+) Transcript_13302:4502-5104(+)
MPYRTDLHCVPHQHDPLLLHDRVWLILLLPQVARHDPFVHNHDRLIPLDHTYPRLQYVDNHVQHYPTNLLHLLPLLPGTRLHYFEPYHPRSYNRHHHLQHCRLHLPKGAIHDHLQPSYQDCTIEVRLHRLVKNEHDDDDVPRHVGLIELHDFHAVLVEKMILPRKKVEGTPGMFRYCYYCSHHFQIRRHRHHHHRQFDDV